MTYLKPCPFCGSIDVIVDLTNVECMFCNALGPLVIVSGEKNDFSDEGLSRVRDQAGKLWNKRV